MKQLKASSTGRDMSRVFIVRPNFFSNSGSSACTSWLLAYSVPSDVSDSVVPPLGDGVIGESGAWTLVPVLTAEAVRSLSVGSLRPGKCLSKLAISLVMITLHWI
ncbi:hypothetical protein T12_10559 [Trichinella patagoniensis]|uniref:Uncharacterized protein n=1 Tax=Trichinella patagoniensis TaxID=990121 RepID=A0A0V0ZD09_9BILA|nr:hypothetical protein T12_10559 [Trichinella patagoniensis]